MGYKDNYNMNRDKNKRWDREYDRKCFTRWKLAKAMLFRELTNPRFIFPEGYGESRPKRPLVPKPTADTGGPTPPSLQTFSL